MGPVLREFARGNGRTTQVRKTVEWILTHYAKRVTVDDLDGIAGMSVTSFHRHFKAVTAMPPLEFLKRIRLHKARDMLIAGARGVALTAYAVGYESASQFSREYARQFGHPPTEDATKTTGRTRQDQPVQP